jgi:hypothetical protein
VRIGEKSSFTGAGSSELRFRLPTAGLEEAMVALDSLGGHVTSQEVDLSTASHQATSVQTGVNDLSSCLDRVSGVMDTDLATAKARLAACQNAASAVGHQIDGATGNVDESELDVRIHPNEESNPVLVAAVVLLIIAAGGLSVMVWRSTRTRSDVDLRDLDDFGHFDDDPFLRRN